MNILNTILEAGLNENVLNTISSKTGMDTDSLQSVIGELAPQLLNGAKENLAGENDSSNLINMISSTNLDELTSNPDTMENMDMSNMAGEIFSNLNENEDDMAQAVSAKSGIDASAISSLIPMLAPIVMGALNKQTNLSNTDTSNTNDITSMLTNFIDQDNDGSVVDDLANLAKKFF